MAQVVNTQPQIGGKLISGERKWKFDVPLVTLGRSARALIQVDDPTASRIHCVLRMDDAGKYWVIDWGSRHGTKYNQKRMAAPVQLKTGDTIAIGSQEFYFVGNDGAGLEEARKSAFISATSRQGGQQVNVPIMSVSLIPRRAMSGEISGWFFGQWAQRQEALVEAAGGRFDKLTAQYQLSYWEAGMSSVGSADAIVECGRECLKVVQDVTADGVELHGLDPNDPPYISGVGLHQGYATLHRLGSDSGEAFAIVGEEIDICRDVMLRATETAAGMASTEAFTMDLANAGLALPFCIANVGPRQRSLVLHQFV